MVGLLTDAKRKFSEVRQNQDVRKMFSSREIPESFFLFIDHISDKIEDEITYIALAEVLLKSTSELVTCENISQDLIEKREEVLENLHNFVCVVCKVAGFEFAHLFLDLLNLIGQIHDDYEEDDFDDESTSFIGIIIM